MATRFGRFVLDASRHQLLAAGVDVHLTLKAFALLALLVQERPRVVPKDEIHLRIWPGVFVCDSTLNSVVAEVRSALGESAHDPRFIRTVHGVGYAFAGDATECGDGQKVRPRASLVWLTVGERQIELHEGENLVGRDSRVAVIVDDLTVSKRHARLTVTDGQVTLEDLSSKNGTYVDGVAVTTPVPVQDGSRILFGRSVATFRSLATPASTATAQVGDLEGLAG